MFVEGTLLTGGVGWAIPPGTPSPISEASIELPYATALCKFILTALQLICN